MNMKKEVIKKLDSVFPQVPIYGEDIEQGFEEPCFFVKRIEGTLRAKLSSRYKETNSFDVHYFAKDNQDAELMSEKLCFEMDYLLDHVAKATNVKYEIVDGVLHFMVDYNTTILKQQPPKTKMQRMEVNTYVGREI